MSADYIQPTIQKDTEIIPWLSIWFKPRITIRQIIDHTPEKHIPILAITSGIFCVIDQASERGLGDTISVLGILGLAVVIGPIAGYLSMYLSGMLFRWTGSWLGGIATDRDVRVVYAWSSIVDTVGLLIMYIPLILLFGRELFQSSANWINSPAGHFIGVLVILIGVTMLIWKAIIFLGGLAEVHNFSIWKSLGATILGFIVILIPILCILTPSFLAR